MAGIYSTRFMLRSNSTGTGVWVVPASKRAVVKQANWYNGKASAVNGSLLINGLGIWAASVPATSSAQAAAFFMVLNAGDTLGLYTGDVLMVAQVSGFLFDEAPGLGRAVLELPSDPFAGYDPAFAPYEWVGPETT